MLNVYCEKCKQVFSAEGSFHPDHGNAVVAVGYCDCPDVKMGSVIWNNDFSRAGMRQATAQEVAARQEASDQILRQSAQERYESATEAALSVLVAYLEEKSPKTILYFKREWRRQGPTHRKTLKKAAIAVSKSDGNIRPKMLEQVFKQAMGYR